MNSRVPGIDEATAQLRELLEADPDPSPLFQRRYEMSWLVHDNALDGLVITAEEIDQAFGTHLVAEGSALATLNAIRNHKQTLDMVRELVREKRRIDVDWLVSLYETLIQNTHLNAKLKAVYRKDMPLHRSYFHEIVEPEAVESELAKWVEELESAEFLENHPIMRAAIAHWELMRIFPFAEHNGRIARLVQCAFLLESDYFLAVIHASERQRYYESLGKSPTALCNLLLDSMNNCLDISIRSLLPVERRYATQ